MTSRRPASVLRKLFGSLKSRDSLKSAREGRLLRLEVLEERTLLTASAGVAATDAISYEGSTSDVGIWRIERAEASADALPVSFKLAGTAGWDLDYRLYDLSTASYITPTSVYNQELGEYETIGEATIPGGSTAVELELQPNADALQETRESATLTLLASDEYDVVGPGATIEIVDANSWSIDVSTSDPSASESSTSDYATFTLTRSGSLALSTATTVRFEVGGSATPNSDYALYNANSQTVSLTPVSGTNRHYGCVQIPAGQTSATVQLRPINDSNWEPTETATFEVVPNPSCYYNVGFSSSATATISDNDAWTLNVAALDSEGAETGYGAPSNPLVFRFSRSGETDFSKPTTVWFGLNGAAAYSSDYNLSGASYNSSNGYATATIPANASYVDVTLNVVDDALLESTETVGVFLRNKPTGASGSDYELGADFWATGTILDDDGWSVDVVATDAVGSETIPGATSDPIVFTLTRSGETNLSKATTVYYRLSGLATYSSSYSSSDFTISGGSYNTSYDYGTATIPANSTSTTITLNPYNDARYEDDESVVFTILDRSPTALSPPLEFQYAVGAARSATATIADNDRWTVEVAATDVAGAETASGTTANPVVFTLTRGGATDLAQATTVYYELTGAAVPGADYSVSNGTFSAPYGYLTIPANATSATLTLNVIDDYLIEDRESIVLRILESVPSAFNYSNPDVQYGLGTTSVANAFIDDNENRTVVEIAALDPLARETPPGAPSDGGTFRITRMGDATSALTVCYTTSGTASNGVDYSSLYGSATIPAGATFVDVAVTPTNDQSKESTETIVATLYAREDYYYYGSELPYVVGTDSTATIYLLDDDRDPTGGPYVVPENGAVPLSAFADLESAGWTVDWDLDGDGVFGETGLDASRGVETGSSTTYQAFGTTATDPEQSYPISARVTRGASSWIATTSATVRNVAPQITLAAPSSVGVGATATISGSFVDPGVDAWSGTILFGDEAPGASPVPLTLNATTKTFSASHGYASSGWFDVVVSIDDGKETSTSTRRVKVGAPAAVAISVEGSATALVSGASSVALKSFEVNGNGENVDPRTGETVFQRFKIRNLGAETLTFDASSISAPSNVALVGSFPTSLEPDEERVFTVKWTARGPLNGTLSIPTSDPVVPNFSVGLTGSVAPYSAPTLDGFALLYDSGDDATDKITFNPILTGTVSGNLAGGRVAVEFDLNADSVEDGVATVYVSGGSFEFDPRTVDASWPRPTSGSTNVSVRYRLVHYYDLGAVLSTGAWNAFAYTLVPEPVGSLTVSNLSVSEGLNGGWTRPGSVVLNGSVGGSGTRRLEIVAGSNRTTQTISSSTFGVSLPFGFDYGGSTTIQARVGAYNPTYKTYVYGAWSSLSVAPQLPSVSSFAFQTNSETGPALAGTLSSGIGRGYCEVEISCGGVVLGSTWTNENGAFTFVPRGLPVVDGVVSGTVTARAVYRPTTGSPIFGTPATTTINYSPAPRYAYSTASLVEPGASPSTTSVPSFKVSGSYASDLDVAFEYRWKLSSESDWSTPTFVLGTLDDELNVDEDAENLYWRGTFSIADLYAITSPSAGVSVQTRPLFYDEIVGDYVGTSSWSTFSATFVSPTFSVATIASAALANPTDGLGLVSSDATISGTISSTGELAGVAVEFYVGETRVGRTTTDSNGAFSFEPTGLTTGQVQISVVASQWNPTTRQYESGTAQVVSFEYVASSVSAPRIEELRLADDTGFLGDGTTANATIRGRLANSDGESVDGLLIEYDVDEDGAPDGWTRTNASGEFYFTPELQPGARVVRVRATRWDSAAGTEVAGSWSNVALTLVAPQNPVAPEIRAFGPSTYLYDSQGVKTTYSTQVAGLASSETGFDDVRVEYEILSGGSGTHIGTVGPLGEFCWDSTSIVPASDETNVSIRVRAGRWNEATNTTLWGAWTTTSFVYRTATESVVLGWKNETSDRSGSSYYERKISGSVAPGEGVVSYFVEFDLDGDETADGQTTPNSQDDFAFYVEPTRTSLYVRVVDELVDGTTRAASQGWQTIPISYYHVESESGSTTLDLYFVDDVFYEPYLQVGNYFGTYSYLTVSLDYDYDGTADATLSPDSRGRISRSSIVNALGDEGVAIRNGFSIVYAWVSYPAANKTDKVPVPLLTENASTEEVARFGSFVASAGTVLDYDPTEDPDASASSSTSREFDYQTTPEPATNTATASLSVGAQSDWDVLRNSPIPEIAFPTLDGEAVDLSRDVALLQALDAVSDSYDAAVRAAQNAWTSTYQTLRDAYDATVDAAWNDYSREYARNSDEFETLQAQTWESSDEYQSIQTTYQRELAAINAQNAARTAEISSWYSTELQAIVSYYNAHRYDAHTSACSSYYHTNACELCELQERRREEEGLARLGALRSQKELALNAETQILTAQAQARRDSALADSKETFETARNDRLAQLAQSASQFGKNYEIAVANAIYAFYADETTGGLAGADETYRNAIASAAQTATSASWSAVRAAITAWKNNASTPSDWGTYVDSLYALSQARDLADANAYVARVAASASAQKTADLAAAVAYRNYLTSNATTTCAAECGDIESVRTLQNAVASATAANETATSELYSTELVSQIETSLSSRFARIDEYVANDATRRSIWYSCATSLVGVADYSIRNAAQNAMNRALEILSKEDSIGRFADEAALYETLIDSGERIQREKLEIDRDLQTSLWSALGTYWKSEIATATNKSISTENADNVYATAVEAADKTLALAELAAESTAATAQIASEQTRLNAERTLTQTTSQTLIGSYFTSLIAACGEMTNDAVGDYYASAVSALQSAFNAQVSANSTLESSLITKAVGYATASLGLDTTLAASYINAVYDYFATQNGSSAAALNRTKASDQAEIDARIAYYCAVENENCARDLAVVEANADAARRKLRLLTAWGEYVVDVAWDVDNPDYDSYSYSYMNYFSTDLPTTQTATPSFGSWWNNVPTQFAQVPIISEASAVPYDASTLWNAFDSLNATVVSMETKNAELQRDAAVANAASSYVGAYANGYDAETRAALNDAGTELSADLSAETTLDGALWTAQGTAFSGYLNAIRNADSTSNILSYVTSSVGASITYASALANAYGDFQIANRQNKLNATTLSNPRRAAYQADVVWAQQTKSLRNQYYSASGSVLSDYYASVTSAIATYNAAALDAELTAAQSYFNAERTFSQNVSEANSDYVLTNFNAAKSRALAYLTASVAELTANYAAEAQLAAERADAYAAALEDLLAELAAADLTKFETLSTLKENFEDALTEANAADATLAALNEAELAAEKAQNAATASAAKTSADTTYNNAWRSAWNDAFLAALAESADLAASYDSINAALETALNAASLAYRDAAFGAWEDFLDDALDLDNIYAHNQERINQGGIVANNVFENPTFDYEVCFVAGTQILMADGSTKPIEQIRPGDKVLAADHLNPEEKPAAANVVRFFDNGEKDVVKLIFDSSAQNAETEEIVCTPEHPFYVIDRGWICANDLQLGDFCLSANGEKIAFVSREVVEERRRVYNFEVEGRHTYFVGYFSLAYFLVHNDCNNDETSDNDGVRAFLYGGLYGSARIGQAFMVFPRAIKITNLLGIEDTLRKNDAILEQMRSEIWGKGPKGTLERISDISGRIGVETSQIVIGNEVFMLTGNFVMKTGIFASRKVSPAVKVTQTMIRDERYYVKSVDESRNCFWRWYGKSSIKAQEKALRKLGDMAPEFFMKDGVLYIKDAGKFTGTFEEFLSIWAKGSIRMRTILNDIKPRNIGKDGLIFDPALIPIEKFLKTGIYSCEAIIFFGGKYYLIGFENDILEH